MSKGASEWGDVSQTGVYGEPKSAGGVREWTNEQRGQGPEPESGGLAREGVVSIWFYPLV